MDFREIKRRLSGEVVEYPCRLVEREADRLVLRFDLPHEGEVGGVQLPGGTISLGYYWPHHPYNVYHFIDREGKSLAFYVNLSGPTFIGEDFVEWEDLVVDVLLVPDETLGYRVEILDEEEVPQDIDGATRRHIDHALAEVMRDWPSMVRTLSAHSARLRGR